MKIICSYCREGMGEKEPLDDPGVTHGICPECYKHFSPQWEGLHLSEYLDTFDEPMVVFTSDTRVIAFNKSYAGTFLEEEEKPAGLFGGEFMECAHARLPGGCGQTVHCRSCTIRNTLQATLRTGQPQKNVSAYLNVLKNGKHAVEKLKVSTEMHGLMVRMRIEEDFPKAVGTRA